MSLFGKAPAPAPMAAPAGALPNTLEVELLHPVACENRKNGSACEGETGGAKKNQLRLLQLRLHWAELLYNSHTI